MNSKIYLVIDIGLYLLAVLLACFLSQWNLVCLVFLVLWVLLAAFRAWQTESQTETSQEDECSISMSTGHLGFFPRNVLKPTFFSVLLVLATLSVLLGHTDWWLLLIIPVELFAMAMWLLWTRHRSDFWDLIWRPETLFFMPMLGFAFIAGTSAILYKKPFWTIESQELAAVATIAAFLFALVVMTFQSFHDRLENRKVVGDVRELAREYRKEVHRLTSAHVLETSLSEIEWEDYLSGKGVHAIRCYHATSHLLGFWLSPSTGEPDKLSRVVQLLNNGSRLEIIGPSAYTFRYLVISRLFAAFDLEDISKDRVDALAAFVCEIVSRAGSINPEICQFFALGDRNLALGALRKILGEGRYKTDWWRLLSLIHWALLLTYYRRLIDSYSIYQSPNGGVSEIIEFAERDCYDLYIRASLKPVGKERGNLADFTLWLGKEVALRKAAQQIERMFFPHCSFGLLCPEGVYRRETPQSAYLLSHDVLHTLNFNELIPQSTAVSLIRNSKLIEHHVDVFDRE